MYRIGFLILLSLALVQCSTDFGSGKYVQYSDDLENLKGLDNKITGRKDVFKVGDLPQVQRDTVKSGKNAIRLNPEFPYGLNFSLPKVKTDEFVEVSIWYSGPGQVVLVASHKDAKYFYRKSSSLEPNADEWRELKLSVSVPPNMNKEDLNIYVWNPGKEPVYVDDFKLSYSKYKSYPVYNSEEKIHLLIDTLDMIRLEQKRNDAFANGILETGDDDYVNGIMYYNDSIMPVEIRLKGDWLDHLEGRKWSFRIKMRKQNTWKNLRAFSLHTPIARDFLNEYVSHEIFRRNDLLAPRYGFVPVTLNGTSLGIYAWEEHFEKQLVEAMNRREGPIMKFDESSFWQSQKIYIQEAQYFELPFLQSADIQAFKLGRTLGDPTLRNNFILANNLMYEYKQGLRKTSELFDVDKMAGYCALMDLTRGFHGLAWHNQRYYYNPVLCRLEPIFFDAYTEEGVFNSDKNAISGLFNFNSDSEKRFENLFWVHLFQDEEFIKDYIVWLDKVSDPAWINSFLQEESQNIASLEKLIGQEFEQYRYDYGFLLENARKIRLEMPYYKEMVEANPKYAYFDRDKITYISYSKKYDARLPQLYVNSYLQDSTSTEYMVQIENYYPLEIEVLGSGVSEIAMDIAFDPPYEIGAFEKVNPVIRKLPLAKGSKYIYYRVKGFDDRFPLEIMNYPPPTDFTPEQELFSITELPEMPFYKVEGNSVRFIKGQYLVNEPIIIPEGYNPIFEAGCELNFMDSSFFISRSAITMEGTAENPVRIYSGDNSAMGFTVLQSDGLCKLDYVVFDGLNTLNYKGWSLTGAVNFFESDVEIYQVDFNSNVCEDALNIIRSEFKVSNSRFYKTFADAFDSDFCKGLVEEMVFENIGNDAIDFSGSVVKITDCKIIKPGDKGVSAGEGSNLTVINTSVSGAIIGFASKDNSYLTLDKCNAVDVNYALAAYQKKPEYGPGNIKTNNFNASGASNLYIIERFSRLSLNGTIVQGEATKVANLFY